MRLLICEDEEDILNALAKGLRKQNYYVDTAADGEEALELYFESKYDLIVLDLNMPKLDGIEVLKAVREENSDCKVIILSARDTLNDKVLGLDLGANDYLVKPFHFKELEARIRALLRTSYNKNRLVSTAELLEHNIDMNASDASNVIKVHIAAIRKKLGSDVIKTNRGMGYTIAT